MASLWAEAPTAGWPPSLRSEIFNVRRRCAPLSHVPNEHTQNPMARKIRDDWWVRPSHGEAIGLRQPRFWIRVFLLLDRLPTKANEPCLPGSAGYSAGGSLSSLQWFTLPVVRREEAHCWTLEQSLHSRKACPAFYKDLSDQWQDPPRPMLHLHTHRETDRQTQVIL